MRATALCCECEAPRPETRPIVPPPVVDEALDERRRRVSRRLTRRTALLLRAGGAAAGRGAGRLRALHARRLPGARCRAICCGEDGGGRERERWAAAKGGGRRRAHHGASCGCVVGREIARGRGAGRGGRGGRAVDLAPASSSSAPAAATRLLLRRLLRLLRRLRAAAAELSWRCRRPAPPPRARPPASAAIPGAIPGYMCCGGAICGIIGIGIPVVAECTAFFGQRASRPWPRGL